MSATRQRPDRSGPAPVRVSFAKAASRSFYDRLPEVTRRDSRGQGQTDVPAEQPSAGQGSWISTAYADTRGPRYRHRPSAQGPSFADCLTCGSGGVLPARYRMTRSADFSHTVKHGVRASQPDLVVHACRSADGIGPQVGFIVTKSVGGAVHRHRLARRLRHQARALLPELEVGDRIVVRALPTSGQTSSARLGDELRAGVRRAHDLLEHRR